MTASTMEWADKFRAARKAAGFSSSEKLALRLGCARRTALRWETGEALPRDYADQIAAISPELARVIEELPLGDSHQAGFAERLTTLGRRLQELEELAAGQAEDTLAVLELLAHDVAILFAHVPAAGAPSALPKLKHD